MELIFLGYPGSGKGTQAKLLSDAHDIPQVSTGDMLRQAIANETALGVAAKRLMDTGKLVSDKVVIGLVEERIQKTDALSGFILDGFPRTISQAQELDRLLYTYMRTIKGVLNLEVARKKIFDRLTKRRVCTECGRVFNLEFDPPPSSALCDNCGKRNTIILRPDDSEETVKFRMNVYEEQTRPLKEYYGSQGKLFTVDGSLNIVTVQEEIAHKVKEIRLQA